MKNYSNLYFKIIDKIRNNLVTEEALNDIVEELKDYFHNDGVCLFNIDKQQSTSLYELKSVYGQNFLRNEESIVKFIKIYSSNYLKEKSHFIITDKDSESTPAELINFIKESNIKTALFVPIKMEKKICGILLLVDKREYSKWNIEDIKQIQAVIEHAYYVVKNKELNNELKQEEERKKIVKKVLKNFKKINDINELKQILAKDISSLIKSDKCLIRFIDSETMQCFYDKDVVHCQSAEAQTEPLILPKDFSKKYFPHLKKGLPICIPNVKKLTDTLYDPDLACIFDNYNSKSTYLFPMRYKEDLTGLVQVDYVSDKHVLLTHDIETIMLIIDHVTFLIENNRVFTKLKSYIDLDNFLAEEDNIVINKRIASKLGLNCAILYSYLLKSSHNHSSNLSNYNNDFLPVPTPNAIQKATFLNSIEQENALLELKYKKLIVVKELNPLEMHYKLSEKAILDQILESNNKTPKEISDKLYIKISETFNIYNHIYSKEVIESTNMLLKKLARFKINDMLIHTNLYSALISTMQDYFQKHNMENRTTKAFMTNFLDSYLSSETNYVTLKFDDFVFKRFKLFWQYKLKEILFLVTDSKIRCSFLQNFDINAFD